MVKHRQYKLESAPDSLYADNVNSRAQDVEEAEELFERTKDIMKEDEFYLRKFHSNSEEVMTKFDVMKLKCKII